MARVGYLENIVVRLMIEARYFVTGIRPRIFNRIPIINLLEIDRIKKESYCCGAGVGARILSHDDSVAICLGRTENFKKERGDFLITACPYRLYDFDLRISIPSTSVN